MYMSSPKHQSDKAASVSSQQSNQEDRTLIDIKQSACEHTSLSKHILQIYALTGADTVAAVFKFGKKRALNTLMSFSESAQDISQTEKSHTEKIF